MAYRDIHLNETLEQLIRFILCGSRTNLLKASLLRYDTIKVTENSSNSGFETQTSNYCDSTRSYGMGYVNT